MYNPCCGCGDERDERGDYEYYLDSCERDDRDYDDDDELPDYPEDGMTDVEADADTLRNAGWGTDEDYGYYGDPGFDDYYDDSGDLEI